MKIPDKVKVLGHEYTVELAKDAGHTRRDLGTTNLVQHKIFVDAGYPETRQAEVFLHEVMHAVFYNMGMGDVEGLDPKEEYIVGTLASGLYQVIKDNKLEIE